MGLTIKTNKAGLYSLTSSVSDESYHPDKKWITEDEAKKVLIENAYFDFVRKAIEIDMTFPEAYVGNRHSPKYLQWIIQQLGKENYDELLQVEFDKVLAKHDLKCTFG